MAAPSAPAVPVLRLGPVPHSLHIFNAAVATTTLYSFYISGITGKGKAGGWHVKKTASVPDLVVYDLPTWPEVFVVMTGTNVGDEESADSTEATIAGWQ